MLTVLVIQRQKQNKPRTDYTDNKTYNDRKIAGQNTVNGPSCRTRRKYNIRNYRNIF